MALPELAVMQQTFDLLSSLDPQARRRVLRWVKAALKEAEPVAGPDVTGHGGVEKLEVAELADAAVAVEPAGESLADEPMPAGGDGTVTGVAAAVEPAPAPEQAVRRGRRAAKPADKPARRRAGKAAGAAVEPSLVTNAGKRGRPPADELMRVYQEVGGKLTEVAKRYGKPYGTVQGWASTLRGQGYPIGRSRAH